MLLSIYVLLSRNFHEIGADLTNNRYKGMGQSSSGSTAASKNVTPQATGGFSQISARGGGEGGGQQMSVLLSWHEKVR